jgi:hypothetical protein
MSPERGEADQRKSFRCPILEGQEAELLVGQSWMPVRIRDASAGGFAVLAATCPPAQEGQTLELRTSSGRFEVRLAHLRSLESTAGARGAQFCLGLERLRDVPDPDEEKSFRARWRVRLFPGQPAASLGAMVVSGLAAAVLLIGIPVAAILVLQRPNHPAAKPLVTWGKRALAYFQPPSSWRPRPAKDSEKASLSKRSAEHSRSWNSEAEKPRRDSPRPDVATTGVIAAGHEVAASSVASLRAAVDRLPGAAALVLPEVVEFLALSEPQQEAVRHILDRSASVLEEIDRRVRQTDLPRAEQRRLVLEAARLQALEVLSPEQQARWATLVEPEDEMAAPDSP